MHIFYSPSGIRKIITLLLICGMAPFVFAQEEVPDYEVNRGFLEYREVPEVKKGTVIFSTVSCEKASTPVVSREKVSAPQPRRDKLAALKKKALIYRNHGWRYQKSGDIKRAMAFYKKAIRVDPNFAAAYNDLAVIYERKGELDLAEKYYLKAVNIDPYYLSAYSNLALLYEQKERFDKAAYFWKRRLELGCVGDPWAEKAKKHLESIRQTSLKSPKKIDTSIYEEHGQRHEEQRILDMIEEALSEADKLQ